MPHMYRLLILDGHNSHCTYPFIKFAAAHRIIIICLPSHTTHALQPCDVGVFGPLARAWKFQVTKASQENMPITKANLLLYYHKARTIALKPSTILSSFRKTGIYPFDRNAIPTSAFEPAKNTTTQAAQPLPAQLPSLLTPIPSPAASAAVLTPNSTPAASAAPSSLSHDVGTPEDDHSADPVVPETNPVVDEDSDMIADITVEPEPTRRYAIQLPPPLPNSALRQALQSENMMLRDIIEKAGAVLERDYAQMKLMDLENERLRQKAFSKDKQKAANKKQNSGQARHMTAPEMMDLLARQTWESAMGDLFKEVSEIFKARKKEIDIHHKAIADEKKAEEKARKAAERQAKKKEAEAEKARVQAERAASCGRGRGRGQGRGQSRGRGGRGQVGGTRKMETTPESGCEEVSDAESTLTDENDIPIVETIADSKDRVQRACRARAPRFFPDDDEEEIVPLVVRPRPRPRPRFRQVAESEQGPVPGVSSAHDTGIQLAEDVGMAPLVVRPRPRPQPRFCQVAEPEQLEGPAPGVISAHDTGVQLAEDVGMDVDHAAQFVVGDDENQLPMTQRRSKRLAVKGK
jgi:DDE superfamily endonuclease